MKLAIILAFMAVVAGMEQNIYKLRQENVLNLIKIGRPCAVENNVDPDIYPRIVDGTLPRDESTNKYMYCVGRESGLIAEDGHVVVDRMANLLKDHPLMEKFKEVLELCNKTTKENPLATLEEMNRCVISNSPVRIVF